MRLRFFNKTIVVHHPDIIGFVIRRDETDLGSEYTTVGLMYKDGSYVHKRDWENYGARIEK